MIFEWPVNKYEILNPQKSKITNSEPHELMWAWIKFYQICYSELLNQMRLVITYWDQSYQHNPALTDRIFIYCWVSARIISFREAINKKKAAKR